MQPNQKQVTPTPNPVMLATQQQDRVRIHLENSLKSSLTLSIPFSNLTFSNFEYESETDQWHFTMKLEFPVPVECREVNMGEERDRRNRIIAEFIRNARIDLFQAIKKEIGHMYFVASIDEYRLKTPLIPQHITEYSQEKSKWILLNEAERTALKQQFPDKRKMVEYSETVMNKNMFRFDEANKEEPFTPLVYSHIEAEYSFILANMTYLNYVNEKRRNAKR